MRLLREMQTMEGLLCEVSERSNYPIGLFVWSTELNEDK